MFKWLLYLAILSSHLLIYFVRDLYVLGYAKNIFYYYYYLLYYVDCDETPTHASACGGVCLFEESS